MYDLLSSTNGLRYAHRANRHNANRPGPGGKNYPRRGMPLHARTHNVYPHSSTSQRQRYARQLLNNQLNLPKL